MSLTIEAHLVDGGLLRFNAAPGLLAKLERLQLQGLRGQELIHELLTDDWGAPPTFVQHLRR